MKIKIDPRYFLMINHSFLIIFGMSYTTMQRSAIQIIFCFVMAILAEIIFSILDKKNLRRKWDDIIKSSVVIGLGLLIFLISRHWWFYGVAAIIAISAKYLLRKDAETHIYNPTGFTIIAMLTFFPNYVFVRGDQFNGSLIPIMSVVGWGTLAIIYVNRWRLTLSYLLTALLLSLLYCGVTSHRFLLLFGPDLGISGLLFMFLMFTDPKTSPADFKRQIFQGVTVAALNLFFRLQQFAYPQFVALFLFSSFEAILYFAVDKVKMSFFVYAEKLKSFFASKAFVKSLIAVVLFLSIVPIFKSELASFPFSDYRMFTEKRSQSDLYALIPAVQIDNKMTFITTSKSFLSYSFVLKALLNDPSQSNYLNEILRKFAVSYVIENPKTVFDKVYLLKVKYVPNTIVVNSMPQEIVYEYDLPHKEAR